MVVYFLFSVGRVNHVYKGHTHLASVL